MLLFDEDGVRIIPGEDEVENDDGTLRQGEYYNVDGEGNVTTDELYGSTYIADYTSGDIIYVNKALSAKIRHIRAVANTNDSNDANFREENCKSLTDYNSKYFSLTDNAYRESDMWVEHEDSATGETMCYLRMAGNWDGTIPATGLDFNLGVLAKPLAAKITVSYQCIDDEESGAWVDVSSVQVTRVPQNCYYKDVENSESHDHDNYTSYHPRLVYEEDYLTAKNGTVSFYVPQNMRGTTVGNVTASDKTENHTQDATCVIITGTYNVYDSQINEWVSQYIYIQLYPGLNNNDYNVMLRREYHIDCTITADGSTAKWDYDSRVTLEEELPEGAIVHYEFDNDNLDLNSAYDASHNLLGGYPRVGETYYNTYVDNSVRNSGTGNSTYGYYKTKYVNEEGNLVEYEDYDDPRIYDLDIDGLDDYYDRYIYGFAGTTNVIASDEKPFLRNLAAESKDTRYNNEDGHDIFYPTKNHPEIFDCTLMKDNFKRYSTTSLILNYASGELAYYPGNNYINSSFMQLSTGWGAGLNPHDEVFTIVFIGSVGVNDQMGGERGVYYGNSIEWNKRWYFYRYKRSGYVDNVTYGYGSIQTESIDALVADDYQNVQSYDVCNKGWRKVYYNNVDVDATQAEFTVDKYKSSSMRITNERPSTTEFIFDAPISIFGHTSEDNADDAIDGKLRLFLIYDRVLSLDEIDQIRRYAALKGILLYGVQDYNGFDVNVKPEYEPAWDTEIDWNDGIESEGGDVTFGK